MCIVVIVAGGSLLFPKNFTQAGDEYSSCEGVASGKRKCIETSTKDEKGFGAAPLWDYCVDGYATLALCKEGIGAPKEVEYILCYDTTNPVDAQCIMEDYSWWNITKKAPSDGYKCDVMWWSSKDACEATLTKYLAEAKEAESTVCCIPPKDKKSEVACAEIQANFANKEEVNAKCATELGGDENYAFRQKGACSAVSDCKKIGAKKKTGTGTGTGSGVLPTKKPVGGGNFIIGDLIDPFGKYTVQSFIGIIIKSSLSVVGTIALVLFIYAGIMWMTAAGNEERTRSSAKIMMWTVLGLVVIFASYILITFVFSALQ